MVKTFTTALQSLKKKLSKENCTDIAIKINPATTMKWKFKIFFLKQSQDYQEKTCQRKRKVSHRNVRDKNKWWIKRTEVKCSHTDQTICMKKCRTEEEWKMKFSQKKSDATSRKGLFQVSKPQNKIKAGCSFFSNITKCFTKRMHWLASSINHKYRLFHRNGWVLLIGSNLLPIFLLFTLVFINILSCVYKNADSLWLCTARIIWLQITKASSC